jgi:hypothetical protein
MQLESVEGEHAIHTERAIKDLNNFSFGIFCRRLGVQAPVTITISGEQACNPYGALANVQMHGVDLGAPLFARKRTPVPSI